MKKTLLILIAFISFLGLAEGAWALTIYGVVTALDGRQWLDRNLGATRVATGTTDSLSYGGYYQWGRGADGHQVENSDVTFDISSSDTPGHDDFIATSTAPYDWRWPKNDNLWQGVNGVNNPCPAGFRLPTRTEWSALVTAEGISNRDTAFSSSLKLPASGYRNLANGALSGRGSNGYYWSSSPSGADAFRLRFDASAVYPAFPNNRAYGFSIRCIKEIVSTPPTQFLSSVQLKGNTIIK